MYLLSHIGDNKFPQVVLGPPTQTHTNFQQRNKQSVMLISHQCLISTVLRLSSNCLTQTALIPVHSPLLAQALQFHSKKLWDFVKSLMVPRGDYLLSMHSLHIILSTTSKFINLWIKLFKILPQSPYTLYQRVKPGVSLSTRVKGKSQQDLVIIWGHESGASLCTSKEAEQTTWDTGRALTFHLSYRLLDSIFHWWWSHLLLFSYSYS